MSFRFIHEKIRLDLTAHFGGVSVYVQFPVSGIWIDKEGKREKDALIVYEVMADRVEGDFRKTYKEILIRTFRQDDLMIRQMGIGRL